MTDWPYCNNNSLLQIAVYKGSTRTNVKLPAKLTKEKISLANWKWLWPDAKRVVVKCFWSGGISKQLNLNRKLILIRKPLPCLWGGLGGLAAFGGFGGVWSFTTLALPVAGGDGP